MASIDFVAHETVVPASWLNEIDRTQHDILGNPSNAADVRTAIDVVSATDLASTDSGKGTELISYPLSAAEITQSVTPTHPYYAPGDVRRYGAALDGTTNDRAAFVIADSLGEFTVPAGTALIGGSNLELTSRIYMEKGAALKPDTGITLTISGLFNAPDHGEGIDDTDGTVIFNTVTLAVPSEYTTIQAAVNAVPRMLSQYVVITIADGTYAEDVRVPFIISGGMDPYTLTGLESARLIIRGAAATSRDPDVRVKSITVSGCVGGTGHPTITQMTVYDKNSYTNEGGAIEMYGCYGAATW